MKKQDVRRRKIFVSGRIQGRLLGRLSLYWLAYHFVLWHTMFMFRYLAYCNGVVTGGELIGFGALYRNFFDQHWTLLLCGFAVLPVIAWDMLKYTHRVAGPLVRFRNALGQLTRGERVTPIKLRDGDLLDDLRDAFNAYLASLESAAVSRGDELTSNDTETDSTDEHLLGELQSLSTAVEETDPATSEQADDAPLPAGSLAER